METPIKEFLLVKNSILEIINNNKIEEIFKDVSENLANVENDILTDDYNVNFGDDLGSLIINYLSLLSKIYGIEETFSFLESRKHWGIYEDSYFDNKKKSIVIPFYSLRKNISSYIINKKSALGVRDLFDISAFLIHWESNKDKYLA